jgi:hypothetical protein
MHTPLRLLAALSMLVAAPAFAQADEPAPDDSAIRSSIYSNQGPGGRNITAFDRHLKSGIGGYFDIEFTQPFSGAPSNLDLRHVILTASSQVHENLFFNTEIEFEHGGTINFLLGDGEINIEQAWADYTVADWLSLRAGAVLVPFGIVNVLHDSDVRETTTRPLMANGIIPTTWTENGIGFHGLTYPTETWQLTYEGYVTQGLTDRMSAANGLAAARPSARQDNNGNKAVTGRVALSPFLGLDVGLDGYYGAYDPSGNQHLTMLGADALYTVGPFEVLGEYANVATQGGVSTASGIPTAIPTGMDGLYAEGRYRFFPEFLHGTPLGRAGGFNHPTFTLVGRGGWADTNQAAYDASDRTEALLGLNYRPIQTFVVKLELQRLGSPAVGKTDHTLWSSVAMGF